MKRGIGTEYSTGLFSSKEPLLPLVNPQSQPYRRHPYYTQQPPVNVSGPLDNYQHIFRNVAGLPRLDRFERWAADTDNSYGRKAAKGLVKGVNFVANHPIKLFFGIWAILLLSHAFHAWGVAQNIKEGGTGEGPNVFVQSVTAAFSVEAIGTIAFLAIAYGLKFFRGPKRPDYKPFQQFISHIEDIPVEAITDLEKKCIITNPNPESPEECDACVSWYTGFISWLADGADSPSNTKQDLEGVWEAIGYILRDIREHFPFRFQGTVTETLAKELLQVDLVPIEGEHQQAASSETDDRYRLERMTRELVRKHSYSTTGRTATDDQLRQKNWALFKDSPPKSQTDTQQGTVPTPSPLKQEAVSEPSQRLVERDLYNTSLLDHVAPTQPMATVPILSSQRDSFLTASPEEKKAAAKLDWREMQTLERKKTINYRDITMRYRDIAMRVVSHVVNLRKQRTGLLEKEGRRGNAVNILQSLLKGVLTDPFVTDRPDPNRNFKTEQQYKSFQLVNLLRPAMTDGQWHNWRYFYAQDAIVTEAFKRLSPQKQAWMIFTLMSGNDHGKLLALSILQDPRLALTRYSSAEDRGYTTSARDKVSDSCLAAFFKTYLLEFGSMSKERAKKAYKDYKGSDPNTKQLSEFRISITNQMRLQLLWLTENSTGRLKALFEKNAGIAAKILLNFTLDLMDPSDVERTYAVPAEKPLVAPPVTMTYSEEGNSVVHDYRVEPSKHDGRFGFSALGAGVTREQVVKTLLEHVDDKAPIIEYYGRAGTWQLPLHAYLGDEIGELLRRRDVRDTVPKALENGVKLTEIVESHKEKQEELYKEFLFHIPEDQQGAIDSLNAVLKYYCEEKRLQEISEGEVAEFRHKAIETMQMFFEHRERAQKALRSHCREPKIVAAYLKYGIGFNQPLGARTAAMYAAVRGNQVEVYEEGDAKRLELTAKAARPDSPIFRLIVGEHYCEWGVMRDSSTLLTSPIGSSRRADIRTTGAFKLAGSTAMEQSPSLPPHPMATHAQKLYWSVGDPKQQKRIVEEIEYGHPERPSKDGLKESNLKARRKAVKKLFKLDSPENIDAIKKGVLQSESLEALLSRLQGHETRQNAYGVLAALLSDPVSGIDYQRTFQKLVHRHYGDLATDDQIKGFLNWLTDFGPSSIDTNAVRARYTAVMISEAGTQAGVNAWPRADRVLAILTLAYPDSDLITTFDRMHSAFESDVEWGVRQCVFSLVFPIKLLRLPPEGPYGFEFISVDEKTDLLPVIIRGLNGNVLESLNNQKDVHSMGDLMKLMIILGYVGHSEYMNQVVGRFCEVLRDPHAAMDLRTNLALCLLDALDSTKDAKASEQMYNVLSAFIAGLGKNAKSYRPDFIVINRYLKALGALRYKEYGPDNPVEIPVCLESFYLRIATYLLQRSNTSLTPEDDKITAYSLLSHVVFNAPSYANITHAERKHIAKQLALLIDGGFYRTSDDRIRGAHRRMVHKALYMLFSDLKHMDMSQYASSFLEVCQKAGGNIEGNGLKMLFDGLRADPLLSEHFQLTIQTVQMRMLALALYQIYQSMPKHNFQFCSASNKQKSKEEQELVVTRLKNVLRTTEYISNPDNNLEVEYGFASVSLLKKAFKEMGIESDCKRISDFIKTYNHHAVAQPKVSDFFSEEERQRLLSGKPLDSVEMANSEPRDQNPRTTRSFVLMT